MFEILFELLHVVNPQSLQRHCGRPASRGRPNLLLSYMVVVLFALMDCGLIKILTELSLRDEADFSAMALHLLGEVLDLASALFPR